MHRAPLLQLGLLLLSMSAACSEEVTGGGGASQNAGGGAGGSGGDGSGGDASSSANQSVVSATNTASVGDATTSAATTSAGVGGDATTSVTTTTSVGSGIGPGLSLPCQGTCKQGEYCALACESAAKSKCQPVPSFCTDGESTDKDVVCGCDGKLYEGPCDAYAKGADLCPASMCNLKDGYRGCGNYECATATQYCKTITLDGWDPNDACSQSQTSFCVDLPAACVDTHTCACLTAEDDCYGYLCDQSSELMSLFCPTFN